MINGLAITEYWVPTLFYDDHIARDCGKTGRVVKRGKKLTLVALDRDAYDDLLTDADYYADIKRYPDEYRDLRPIVDSAIRTLHRLKA